MKMPNVVYNARKALINIGKCFPFIVCIVVGLQYVEMLFSCVLSHFAMYDGVIIPKATISLIVGQFYEYDIISVLFTLILAYAIETCKWNKIACYYIFGNLVEKSYFTIPLDINKICIICLWNIFFITCILWKGTTILLKIAK